MFAYGAQRSEVLGTYYDLLEISREAMDERNGINIPYPRMDVRVENVKASRHNVSSAIG